MICPMIRFIWLLCSIVPLNYVAFVAMHYLQLKWLFLFWLSLCSSRFHCVEISLSRVSCWFFVAWFPFQLLLLLLFYCYLIDIFNKLFKVLTILLELSLFSTFFYRYVFFRLFLLFVLVSINVYKNNSFVLNLIFLCWLGIWSIFTLDLLVFFLQNRRMSQRFSCDIYFELFVVVMFILSFGLSSFFSFLSFYSTFYFEC